MFRTDHCYPPTVRAPLDDSPVFDFHFEAITMPAPLPPVVEPLAPSPRRTNNPPLPEVTFTDDKAEWLRRDQQRARGAAWTPTAATVVHHRPAKPDHGLSTLAACAVGAALLAVGYLLGRWLP